MLNWLYIWVKSSRCLYQCLFFTNLFVKKEKNVNKTILSLIPLIFLFVWSFIDRRVWSEYWRGKKPKGLHNQKMKNGIYSIKAETKVLNSMPPDNGWESKFAKHKNEYVKKIDIITEFWEIFWCKDRHLFLAYNFSITVV